MSKNMMDYLYQPDVIVVFDVDGVLAPYEFSDHQHGTSDEEWQASFKSDGSSLYDQARPLPVLQDFIKRKGIQNVYVCSQALPEEEPSKTAFLARNYGIPKNHIAYVRNKKDKWLCLEHIAERNGCDNSKVALVEDTVETLDGVMKRGFATVHISSFFDFEVPMDKKIQELRKRLFEYEEKEKKLQEMEAYMRYVSNRLCPDEEENEADDGETIFDHGRGQGIFEMCQKIRKILDPTPSQPAIK